MLQLLVGGVAFVFWSLFMIITYYSKNYSAIDHREASGGEYTAYLIGILMLYGTWKFYTTLGRYEKTIRINFWHIILGFFTQFLLLCIAYSSLSVVKSSPIFGSAFSASSLVLFFHSIQLLLYPLLLIGIWRSAGYALISWMVPGWNEHKLRLRVPAETALGMFVFATGLLVLGGLHLYTLTGLLAILAILIVIGIPGWRETYRNITTTSITYDNHDIKSGDTLSFVSPRLLSAEFAFMALSFLMGVSLINAMRPMPIGWDDLGVYMNFPKIMALSGEALLGAGMYSWQLITGSGFLFSYTAAQAFFVNQIGGILAVIAITCISSLILEDSKKRFLLSLPIIFALMFYMMPMNIFQQAKDMKLDPALLGVSIAGFGLLFSGWKHTLKNRANSMILLLAGLIIGFAFGVKATTLMLFLAGFGLIFYRTLSFFGFLGYLFLFLAIFTEAKLWSTMNIWMPTDTNAITIGLILASIASFIATRNFGDIQRAFISSLVFLAGIVLGMSPWIVKNTLEVQPWKTSTVDTKTKIMTSVLWGSGGSLVVDYTKLYPKEEYEQRTSVMKSNSITSSGQSQNEDFGRYFGYESGINNYLKLPPNLTFQKNQGGEFTDITFLYLALVPSLPLLVRSRKNIFSIFMGVTLVGLLLYWFTPIGSGILTTLLGNIALPLGYGVLLAINIIFLAVAHYSITDDEQGSKIKEVLIFLGVYGFLFLISAFGIVWYGILVYFLFLVLIGLSSMSFTTTEEGDNSDLVGVKLTLTAIFAIFVLTYVFVSALPHGWSNLRGASYNEFKYKTLNQEESIFIYRQDYALPIATMNLTNPTTMIERAKSVATSENLKKLFTDSRLANISLTDFHSLLFSLSHSKKDLTTARDAKNVANTLYKGILYPQTYAPDLVNTGGIYRIGTFMTYLINENRTRYYDDSLVFNLETYFYDPSPEKTIENMKKIGLKYLLVDLNAATIDRDPRRALTTRFEHLLTTMTAKNLTLVSTDNLCLQYALDQHAQGKITNNADFLAIAGTNYDSYRVQSGATETIPRGEKQIQCYNSMLATLKEENIPSYLAPLKKSILELGPNADNKQVSSIFAQYAGQSWFALYEIR